MSNKLLVSLFQYKAWANRDMFEVLRAVPEGQHAREMFIITLTLDHVCVVDRIFQARIAGEPHDFASVVSARAPKLDALWENVSATDQWYIDYAGSASPAHLGEVIDFTFVDDGTPGRMTREEMLGHVLTHGNSHRGAVGKMLEGMGVAGPADMFTSFLHRDRKAAG